MVPDIYTKYATDDEGGIIDPPVIAAHERALVDAQQSADENQIALAQEKYDADREELAERHNQRVERREKEDRRLLAEKAAQQRALSERSQAEAQERERRAELERLRESATEPEPGDDPDKRDTPPSPRPPEREDEAT